MSASKDVITLSSDEEELVPAKKRVKLITIDTNTDKPQTLLRSYIKPQSYIDLSQDSVDESVNKKVKDNGDGDDDGVEIVEWPETENCQKETDLNVNMEAIKNSFPILFVLRAANDNILKCNDSDKNKNVAHGNMLVVGNQNVTEEKIEVADDNVVDASKQDITEEIIEVADDNAIGISEPQATKEETQENGAKEPNKDITTKFYDFLDKCFQVFLKFQDEEMCRQKVDIAKKYFNKLQGLYDEEDFSVLVDNLSKKLNDDCHQTVLCFAELLNWLRHTYANAKKVNSTEINGDVTKTNKKIAKLTKCLNELRKKIKTLEEAEVDFDDDNSSYIMLERYNRRATQVYALLCKYTEDNPYKIRMTHQRLDFSQSSYTEINRAINKNYKRNNKFPTFRDLDKLIRKCVKEKNLDISESMIQQETRICFEKLGKLLKNRRVVDTFQFLNDFAGDEPISDPAASDETIAQALEANQKLYSKKLDDEFEKYCKQQDMNETVPESKSDENSEPESDDSGDEKR